MQRGWRSAISLARIGPGIDVPLDELALLASGLAERRGGGRSAIFDAPGMRQVGASGPARWWDFGALRSQRAER